MRFNSVVFFFVLVINGSTAWAQKVFFSGSDSNAVFLCDDGKVLMTGGNAGGQLGNGTIVSSNIPVLISGISGIGDSPKCKQVEIDGTSTFLALTNSGDTVLAWGPNEFGQIGDGSSQKSLFPVRVKGINGQGFLENIKQIATNNYNGYALTNDGKVLSWGNNVYGTLGNGTFGGMRLYPDYVLIAPNDTLKNVKYVSGDGVHCLALLCDGTVCGWGRNNFGQLAQNSSVNSEYAIRIKNSSGTGFLKNIIKIDSGDDYAFALSSTDTVWAWGNNLNGRLGTGNTTTFRLPTPIVNLTNSGHLSGVSDIAAGQGHGVALLNNHTLVAWGNNQEGQLGDGANTNSSIPVKVKNTDGTGLLSDVNYIGVGDNFCIARSSKNQLFVWGDNTYGQLGLGNNNNVNLPQQLNLTCVPTKDSISFKGKLNYTPEVCKGNNQGVIVLSKYHSSIKEWQSSADNFNIIQSINNTDFINRFSNLTQTTSYRAVYNSCGTISYSDIATIKVDSVTVSGKIIEATTVRKYNNDDTLELKDYRGEVVLWELSEDNFKTYTSINSNQGFVPYSNLNTDTYFRALIQSGVCPAIYTDTVKITVIDESAIKIYDAFTPNNDHYNDEWAIDNIQLFPINTVHIFNRWGQTVFEAQGYDNTVTVWKGENMATGEQLPDATYFYKIQLQESNLILKGNVAIKR